VHLQVQVERKEKKRKEIYLDDQPLGNVGMWPFAQSIFVFLHFLRVILQMTKTLTIIKKQKRIEVYAIFLHFFEWT
jgi:Tfp pilus assembly protein PilO